MQSSDEIATHLLSETGAALVSGDFERFRPCFALPQAVSTSLGTNTVHTIDELKIVFERVRWHYRGLGVTQMPRVCLATMFVDGQTILSVHHTRLLKDGRDVQRPFKVLSMLTCRRSRWQIQNCDYAIADSLRHNRALYGPRTPVGSEAQSLTG